MSEMKFKRNLVKLNVHWVYGEVKDYPEKSNTAVDEDVWVNPLSVMWLCAHPFEPTRTNVFASGQCFRVNAPADEVLMALENAMMTVEGECK